MPPLLTICTIAYNQEKFITQTLEGIVMQRTDFKFEAVVADDASTDGTVKLIAGYAERYPGIIKPVLRDKNLGMIGNFTDVLSRMTGKYIALCEGDDYWTDPLKLQKQVDFLEANPGYAVCFHSVKILTADGKLIDDFAREVPETTDIYELGNGNYIRTASVVFRNNPEVLSDFVLWKFPVGDPVLEFLFATQGKIKKLPGAMAVYRHGIGVSAQTEYWGALGYDVLHLLCEYFKGKDERMYTALALLKNKFAANRIRTLLQAGKEKGVAEFLNGMDCGSKKDFYKYLVNAESSLTDISSSRGWRTLGKLYRLRDVFMPDGSQRWQYVEGFLKLIYRFRS